MDPLHEEQFIVYVREDPGHGDRPDGAEQAVVSCATYAEARRIRRQFISPTSECVIRYVGPCGGGD